MLLSILQCTEQPSQQRMIWTQMSIVRLRNPCLSIRFVPRNTFAEPKGVCFKNVVGIAILPMANFNFENVLSP